MRPAFKGPRRSRRSRIGRTPMYTPIYLWRAVDSEGEVLDVLVQAKRDKWAARKLPRSCPAPRGPAFIGPAKQKFSVRRRRRLGCAPGTTPARAFGPS